MFNFSPVSRGARSLLYAVLFMAATSRVALSDDAVPYEVKTLPPGAVVKIGTKEVGVTNSVIEFDRPPVDPRVSVSLLLDGHEPKTLTADTTSVETLKATFGNVIELEASSSVVALQDFLRYRYHWPLAGLFLIGAVGFVVRSRMKGLAQKVVTAEERAKVLSTYETDSSKIASMFSERIGDYVLVDLLGQGGMAAVYRALPWDTMDPADAVAVKIITKDLAANPEYSSRFQREADICRTLSHPNIVRLIDWGTKDERFYLVLEYVTGGTLANLVEKGELSKAQRRDLLLALCNGLVHAHSKGVTHRDLKPENLMVTPQGALKIMDFGLARSENVDKLTKTGTVMGTPTYMAPEQIDGTGLDSRTDQYALGIIAYEVLTGKVPFEGTDIMQIIFQQLSAQPVPPSTHDPELPDEIDSVILKMMAKKPDDRFATTEETMFHLSQALEGYR